MSVKSDALEFGVTAIAVGAALWYVSRKIGGGLSSVGAALSSAGTAVADGAGSAWSTATSPVLPTDTGVSAVDGAAAIGNGVVAAPTGIVDSLSMGLIGGSGGTSGNGGLGGWLWGIISGSAFAPNGAGSTPGAQPDSGAGFDLGNSQGW
ncbi:hypothetical protein [Burkholderia cepacia]|uniref:Uncharacterized protein n=1 Tax=Burkholderia cepacia TaxID=292 RepID=A0A8I1ALB2_BURCE|nr:hypothetical protein [Burkholderia cepacia]MBA9942167.1 hypothetical protein [Burkholderia cepacia]MBA9990675.1 hypothetical protein [Burkholderia cepacia]MBB0014540.1 hypothetical protein [Burkholderia cepacia]MBB0050770.1 hypothetical protein [Burkholderia cepacia]MBB0051221.1 hypothetical protein [Burkholderia cepacia]